MSSRISEKGRRRWQPKEMLKLALVRVSRLKCSGDRKRPHTSPSELSIGKKKRRNPVPAALLRVPRRTLVRPIIRSQKSSNLSQVVMTTLIGNRLSAKGRVKVRRRRQEEEDSKGSQTSPSTRLLLVGMWIWIPFFLLLFSEDIQPTADSKSSSAHTALPKEVLGDGVTVNVLCPDTTIQGKDGGRAYGSP